MFLLNLTFLHFWSWIKKQLEQILKKMKKQNLPKDVFGHVLKSHHSKINIEWMGAF